MNKGGSEELDYGDKEEVRKRLIERLKNNKQIRMKFWKHLSMGTEFLVLKISLNSTDASQSSAPILGKRKRIDTSFTTKSEKIIQALCLTTEVPDIIISEFFNGEDANTLRLVSKNLRNQIKQPENVLSRLSLNSLISAYSSLRQHEEENASPQRDH